MGRKMLDYTPFYPTTLGTKAHDMTLQKLPAYSIRSKPEIKEKCCKKVIYMELQSQRFLV